MEGFQCNNVHVLCTAVSDDFSFCSGAEELQLGGGPGAKTMTLYIWVYKVMVFGPAGLEKSGFREQEKALLYRGYFDIFDTITHDT